MPHTKQASYVWSVLIPPDTLPNGYASRAGLRQSISHTTYLSMSSSYRWTFGSDLGVSWSSLEFNLSEFMGWELGVVGDKNIWVILSLGVPVS